MSADDSHPQPVIVLRVVIRSPDLDTFVAKYSRFIKDDRIFIFTKSSQPAGTQVRFTLELSDGKPLIHGEGTVTRVRPETADVSKPPGMELKFVPLDQHSRDLVDRMLKARDGTGQFREEPTDAQTQVRSTTSPAREFEERPPTLPTLPQTGAFSALAMGPALGLLPRTDPEMPRQDESGAVTLAQPQPTSTPARPPLPSSAFEAPGTIPSGGFTQPVATGAGTTEPLSAGGDRHSGSYSSPTPLPAPIPAGSEESFVGPSDGSRPNRTELGARVPTPPRAQPIADEPRAFAAHGPAPPFAESFRTPLPGQPPAATPTGTVPANPFSDVSDGAIEYFVEWSLEQSRDAKPKGAKASFSNVKMVTPQAERSRTRREPFLWGLLFGLLFGVPLGAGGIWYVYVRGAELLTAEHAPPAPTRPLVVPDLGTASATAATATTAAPEATTAPKDAAAAPVATAALPTKPPPAEPAKRRSRRPSRRPRRPSRRRASRRNRPSSTGPRRRSLRPSRQRTRTASR